MHNLDKIIQQALVQLKQAPHIENPWTEILILAQHFLNIDQSELFTRKELELDAKRANAFENAVKKRRSAYPMAYLLGYKEFYNYRFWVNESVLIPRPETELLVEAIIDQIQKNHLADIPFSVCDLGAGSGVIGLSLIKTFPQITATFIELSPEACQVCQKNIQAFNVIDRALILNVDFFQLSPKINPFQCIVSNPPYLDEQDPNIDAWVRQYEPRQALFSPNQGLRHIQAVIDFAKNHLIPNGLLGLEHGYQQGPFVEAYLGQNGFYIVKKIMDYQNYWRHTIATKRTKP